MSWLLYIIAFGKFLWGIHERDVIAKTEDELADLERQRIKDEATAEEATAEIEEDLREQQKEQEELRQKQIKSQIRTAEATTEYEIARTETAQAERGAQMRAGRGASGLTAGGSAAIVLQYEMGKYEDLLTLQETLGAEKVKRLKLGLDIADINIELLDLSQEIADIQSTLAQGGFQYQLEVGDVLKGHREWQRGASAFGSILDLGTDIMTVGYTAAQFKLR